jgi:hypothetical protein
MLYVGILILCLSGNCEVVSAPFAYTSKASCEVDAMVVRENFNVATIRGSVPPGITMEFIGCIQVPQNT